jgi:D-threonate/D-erythronate kinase
VWCGIVADDLTGALDAALPFAERGYRAGVRLDRKASLTLDVMAFSTDSRADAADVAADKVRDAIFDLKTLGARRLYKKIDSTLRGPFGAEILAALQAAGQAAAWVCPAFPEQGRVVRDGILCVHGEPLDVSPFGSPLAGVSSLPAILEAVFSRSVRGFPACRRFSKRCFRDQSPT